MQPNSITDYLKVYNTIYPKQKFVYMSLPITTGPKFVEWYVETGQYLIRDSIEYTRLHRESVIFENLKLSIQYAEILHKYLNRIIINPTQFDPDFTQEEFMLFWDDFIREYVDRIIFMPGWAMSKGSLAEYIIGINNKIPCFKYNGGIISRITKEDACDTIEKADKYLQSVGFNSHMQENILKLIEC